MNLTFNRQRWEAAGWTFAQVFVVTIAPSIATVEVGNWGALGGIAASAAMAGLGAALSFLKSTIVRNMGEKESIFLSASDTEEGAG